MQLYCALVITCYLLMLDHAMLFRYETIFVSLIFRLYRYQFLEHYFQVVVFSCKIVFSIFSVFNANFQYILLFFFHEDCGLRNFLISPHISLLFFRPMRNFLVSPQISLIFFQANEKLPSIYSNLTLLLQANEKFPLYSSDLTFIFQC